MDDDANQENNTVKTIEKSNDYSYNFTNFLIISFLSVIIYLLIAGLMNINISEIVDLELPLLIILSLFLSYFSNINRIITYIISAALIIILLINLPQYAFFVIIVFTAELIVYAINKIINNENDY